MDMGWRVPLEGGVEQLPGFNISCELNRMCMISSPKADQQDSS